MYSVEEIAWVLLSPDEYSRMAGLVSGAQEARASTWKVRVRQRVLAVWEALFGRRKSELDSVGERVRRRRR